MKQKENEALRHENQQKLLFSTSGNSLHHSSWAETPGRQKSESFTVKEKSSRQVRMNKLQAGSPEAGHLIIDSVGGFGFFSRS